MQLPDKDWLQPVAGALDDVRAAVEARDDAKLHDAAIGLHLARDYLELTREILDHAADPEPLTVRFYEKEDAI